MPQNIRYINENEWAVALSKAFNFLQEMTIPGTASDNHAQAKGLVKLVFDSIELKAAKEKEEFQQKQQELKRLDAIKQLQAEGQSLEKECCPNGKCESSETCEMV